MAVNLKRPIPCVTMSYLVIVNCFINGAAHAYHARHNAPMVDEDLAMAFDAADLCTKTISVYATMADAHDAGARYIASFHTTPSGVREALAAVN